MNRLDNNICRSVKILEYIVLSVILVAVIFVIGKEVLSMGEALEVSLADILLLFIYLEVLAMVGVFVTAGEFPVRIPLYIGVVALTRHVIIDMAHMSNTTLLAIGGTVLMFAVAAVVIKIGKTKL